MKRGTALLLTSLSTSRSHVRPEVPTIWTRNVHEVSGPRRRQAVSAASDTGSGAKRGVERVPVAWDQGDDTDELLPLLNQ
jgi:hypothetical protein